MKLFAYGTLLAGMRLHDTLAGARRLGPALIHGKLINLGAYAGLVEGDAFVTGEIYEIDHQLLERLDQVEGFRPGDSIGSQYLRKDVLARLFADGAAVEVVTYFFNHATGAEDQIKCGDFRRYETEKNGGNVWVIAYGSNLSTERLAKRLKRFGPERAAQRRATVIPGYLEGFRLTFNKKPQEGGPPYANIEFVDEGARCPAVVWSLTAEEVGVLDENEGATGKSGSAHYYRMGMPFIANNGIIVGHAYLANPDWLQAPAPPSPDYLYHLRKGYREQGLDPRHLEEALADASLQQGGQQFASRKVSSRKSRDIPPRDDVFPCYLVNGHILADTGSDRVLVDTGAMLSFGENDRFELLGRMHRLETSFMGHTVADIGRLVGKKIDVLLGADILAHCDFRIDLDRGELEISEGELQLKPPLIPIESFQGVPIMPAVIDRQEQSFFFDTGAKLSYLHSSMAMGWTPVGTESDFFPGFGEFTVDVGEKPVTVGGRERIVRFGVLPALLEASLILAGVRGILGSALCEGAAVSLAVRRGILSM